MLSKIKKGGEIMRKRFLKLFSFITALSFLTTPCKGTAKIKQKVNDPYYYASNYKVITNIQLGLYAISFKIKDKTGKKALWETIKILQEVKKKDLEKYWKLVEERY